MEEPGAWATEVCARCQRAPRRKTHRWCAECFRDYRKTLVGDENAKTFSGENAKTVKTFSAAAVGVNAGEVGVNTGERRRLRAELDVALEEIARLKSLLAVANAKLVGQALGTKAVVSPKRWEWRVGHGAGSQKLCCQTGACR